MWTRVVTEYQGQEQAPSLDFVVEWAGYQDGQEGQDGGVQDKASHRRIDEPRSCCLLLTGDSSEMGAGIRKRCNKRIGKLEKSMDSKGLVFIFFVL